MFKKFTPLAFFLLGALSTLHAQVGIGTTSPDGSAALQVNSTVKGLLLPRMTELQRQAITTPASGLIIYQTDNTAGFYYNVGTPASPNWVILLNGSSSISAANITGTITSAQIANGAVTTSKLDATGTPSASTYLRGDGSWASVSGGSGAVLDLEATNTASQTIGTSATADVSYNNFSATRLISGASFNGTTYTVGSSGTYLVTASIVASANAAISPTILVNGNPVAHGTATSAFAFAAGSQGRGIVSVMLSLTAGDTIKISGTNANSTVSAVLSTNGTTRFSIAKL